MLRKILFVGGASLIVAIGYQAFIAPNTPDRTLFSIAGVDVTTDHLGEAAAMAVLVGPLASMLRGVGE